MTCTAVHCLVWSVSGFLKHTGSFNLDLHQAVAYIAYLRHNMNELQLGSVQVAAI